MMMSSDTIAPPEKKEIGVTRSTELRDLSTKRTTEEQPNRQRAVRELRVLPGKHHRYFILLGPWMFAPSSAPTGGASGANQRPPTRSPPPRKVAPPIRRIGRAPSAFQPARRL
jgi:hypothetical protein